MWQWPRLGTVARGGRVSDSCLSSVPSADRSQGSQAERLHSGVGALREHREPPARPRVRGSCIFSSRGGRCGVPTPLRAAQAGEARMVPLFVMNSFVELPLTSTRPTQFKFKCAAQ